MCHDETESRSVEAKFFEGLSDVAEKIRHGSLEVEARSNARYRARNECKTGVNHVIHAHFEIAESP